MEEPLRILILEDNPVDAELIQFELDEAGIIFTPKVVINEEDFVRAIQEFLPDLILSDYDLLLYDGALALTEAKRRCPDTPFILVTGAVTENRAIDILTQGAKDYVLKNRLHQRLVPAVQRTLAEAKEHRARKQAEAALREAHRTLEERVKTRTAELEAEITARKKTDEALLESEAVLRSFFDATGDMRGIVEVVAIDDVRHIAANVITANFCGLTPEMMRNRLGSELGASWEVLLMWIGFYEESRRTQKPVSFEYEDRWNDKEAWLSATVSYLGINTDGEPRFAYTVRDISERKQAEAVVQRQAQLLDLSYDAIFAWHLNGPIEFWNRGAENLYGYNRDEAVGCVTHDLIQTQHPVPLDEIKEVLLRDGQWTGEVTHVTKDGRTIVVNTRHQLIGDAQGRQIVLEINRDVTEHKRAKEAADATHRQVQGIIDNATALIYAFDLEGRFVMANKAVAEVLNSTPEQMIGKKRHEFMPKDNADWHEANERQVLESGRAMEFEEYSQVKGRAITWLTIKFPLSDAQGMIYAVGGISTDITARKQVEMELMKQTKELDDANRELESFSYSVSHDLKAPLRAIDGFSRMVLKKNVDNLSEDTLRKLDVIRRNAEKMSVLIDDLLSFSKMLKSNITVSEINMDKLAKEVWGEIQAANTERELELRITSMLPGNGDPTLIRQVLFSLISNAVKFTKTRKPGIIEVGCYSENGNVVYCVKDNGVGFDMAYYDKLFGVFQRLHSYVEYEGTGVGLAIVHRIIVRHGGRVWAEGKVDKGAAFYFTLSQKVPLP